MGDQICPQCGKILPYDPEFQGYKCKYCGYRQEYFPGKEVLALQTEISKLKAQIVQLQKKEAEEINIGDTRFCIFDGNKELKAYVVEMTIGQITYRKKGIANYTFYNVEKDSKPKCLSFCQTFNTKTFTTRAPAEKELRRLLAKRERQDGRVRQVKSNPQIAAENRAKYEAEKSEESEECL